MTAFFVQSLANLQQDEVARTNEILVNLTQIIIQLSGVDSANLDISSPIPFTPNASDVRLNVYWSLALVLSVGF